MKKKWAVHFSGAALVIVTLILAEFCLKDAADLRPVFTDRYFPDDLFCFFGALCGAVLIWTSAYRLLFQRERSAADAGLHAAFLVLSALCLIFCELQLFEAYSLGYRNLSILIAVLLAGKAIHIVLPILTRKRGLPFQMNAAKGIVLLSGACGIFATVIVMLVRMQNAVDPSVQLSRIMISFTLYYLFRMILCEAVFWTSLYHLIFRKKRTAAGAVTQLVFLAFAALCLVLCALEYSAVLRPFAFRRWMMIALLAGWIVSGVITKLERKQEI